MTMTIIDHLNAAYSFNHKLSDAPHSDPVAACAAAGFDKAALQAMSAAFAAVEDQCVVSRTHRVFVDRVLAAMPAPGLPGL